MKPELFLEEKKHCLSCRNESFFFVRKESCETCENNGISVAEGYAYKKQKEDEKRTEVEDEGECLLGEAHGEGCTILVCSKCGLLHDHTSFRYD